MGTLSEFETNVDSKTIMVPSIGLGVYYNLVCQLIREG